MVPQSKLFHIISLFKHGSLTDQFHGPRHDTVCNKYGPVTLDIAGMPTVCKREREAGATWKI